MTPFSYGILGLIVISVVGVYLGTRPLKEKKKSK